MELSARMQALADLVTAGNRLADIGTDHAYLPIALCQREKIPSALAMDVGTGPLAIARSHIASCRLLDRIEVRLSDGLTALREGEADTILIAGMGGMLTIHILETNPVALHSASELILQPQSDIKAVRIWLQEHNYTIVQENMVLEEGKYYPMMRCQKASSFSKEQVPAEKKELFLLYGAHLLKDRHPVLQQYLLQEKKQLQTLIQILTPKSDQERCCRRLEEVKALLFQNEKALSLYYDI